MVAIGGQLRRNGIKHDRRRVKGRELRGRGVVQRKHLVIHLRLVPSRRLQVIGINSRLVPRDPFSRRRLVLVSAADSVAKLVEDDTLELALCRLVREPAKVHGGLVLGEHEVVRADVGPRGAAVVDVDADLGVAVVDKGEGDVSVLRPLGGDVADLLLDCRGAVEDLDAEVGACGPHAADGEGEERSYLVVGGVFVGAVEGVYLHCKVICLFL